MSVAKKRAVDPIRDIWSYVKLFYSHVGVRFYVVLIAAVLASIAESVGIMMLLPLLESVGGIESGAMGGVGESLAAGLAWLGLGGSTLGILLFMVLLFLIKGAFLFASAAYANYLSIQMIRELKVGLYDRFSRMSLEYYVERHTGHFVNVITAQVTGFVTTFKIAVNLGAKLAMALVYGVLATAVAWGFGVMAIILGVLFFMAFRQVNLVVRGLSRANAVEAGAHTKLLIQSLQSFKYLASTNTGDKVRTGVVTTLERILKRALRIGLWQAFSNSVREPFAVVALVMIVAVQLLVFEHSLGAMIIAMVLFYRSLGNFLALQSHWQSFLSGVGSVEMIRAESIDQARAQEKDGTVDVGPLSKAIELREVCFAYSDGQPDILAGIKLTIPAQKTVAIVGESGSGKSTLVDLLTLMLKPRRGQLLIDGVPGEAIRLASWRRQIGFVSQESVVFDDTIANNICLWEGDVDADPDLYARVREAARQAHLMHVVESLPAGYHTVVGDRGVRLSGGQRQRLFVARELFKRPRLLILDEATSALDSESERAIQESIDALKGKMTVVMVAHRLATIRNVDMIFVLDQGRLVEQGDFASLQQDAGSRFARLVSLQRL